MPLVTFLQNLFQLLINNPAREPTTRYGTTIDAVFSKYLENIISRTFVTYFSYNRPILTFVETGKPTGERHFWRPRRRWEDNIRMHLAQIGINAGNWVDSAQDLNYWRALVNAALNLRVP